RSGHVFEGRYKATPVQDERYLLSLIRYIHRNPVRAKMCERVDAYRWSSDHFYRHHELDFVRIDLLLGILANDQKVALQEYSRLMEIVDEEQEKQIKEADYSGSEAFAMVVEPRKAVPPRKSLDEILLGTGLSIEEYEQVKAGSRKHSLQCFKAAYAQEASKQGYSMRSMREIGIHIGLTDSAVNKYMGSGY
ncbi:MAG: hypothetical protein U9N81_06010, partial [Bacillota bacterium]|nr:hypothetical protein [Bacillota bacterium]